jgi:hypothetical protein
VVQHTKMGKNIPNYLFIKFFSLEKALCYIYICMLCCN